MSRVLAAILSQPWAIRAEMLEVIVAIADRALDHPALLAAREEWKTREAEGLFAAATPLRRLPGAASALYHDGVAILPVFGAIFPRANLMTEMSGATSIARLDADLNAALAEPDVRAILLAIDSPGGAVTGTDAFADRLYALRARLPIWAHVQGSGASGAYWLASSTARIEADRSAILGSIGVLLGATIQKGPDRDNRERVEIVSSGAPDKRIDAGTDEGRAKIQAMLDEVEAQFVADVARGRGVTREKVLADFGQGGLRVAPSAMAAGMIDAVSGFDATLARLAASVAKAAPKTAAAPARFAAQSDIRIREAGLT